MGWRGDGGGRGPRRIPGGSASLRQDPHGYSRIPRVFVRACAWFLWSFLPSFSAGRMGLGGMLNTSTSRETGRRRLSRARTGVRAPTEVGGRAMAAWPSRRDDYTAAEGWIVSPSVPTGGGLGRRELRLINHRCARSREHEASARITR